MCRRFFHAQFLDIFHVYRSDGLLAHPARASLSTRKVMSVNRPLTELHKKKLTDARKAPRRTKKKTDRIKSKDVIADEPKKVGVCALKNVLKPLLAFYKLEACASD